MKHICSKPGGGDTVYAFGMLGAVVYYMQHASSFTDVMTGLFKSVLWPAFVVHKGLTLLNM